MPALGNNSERVGNTKKKVLRRYRDMLWLYAKRCLSYAEHEAGKKTTSWRDPERTCLVVEAWVGSSAGLLSKCQTAGPKSFASFRRGSIPVRMPWGISPNWSGAPKIVQRRYRGLRLLLAERCCEMRSARRAKSQHAGLARSEQVWLLRLGSAPPRGCRATGRGQDHQVGPLVSCVLGSAVLSGEEQSSEVQRHLHIVQSCRPCATRAATNRRPCRLAVVVVAAGGGR